MNIAGHAEINILGSNLLLLPGRAVYWLEKKKLIIADMHIGKTSALRAEGIPVPGGVTSSDLGRLSSLIDALNPAELIILGDLIHSEEGRSEKTFASFDRWRGRHKELLITLIRGNHDIKAGDPPEFLGINCLDRSLIEPPFIFCHNPVSAAEGYVLAGHIHPAVMLTGAGRQRLKLPCFYFGAEAGILPAFGSFTGNYIITPAPGSRVFVIADNNVTEVN